MEIVLESDRPLTAYTSNRAHAFCMPDDLRQGSHTHKI
jgi:hypothetical protein